ncbi:MAG: glycosyltransferase family 4 protein [Phenylobacterium sp.]|uniref:glycosyltransferase family 4 protein n=1 Tax=Phenylobacterium sp. TaxID=1871053 RepID=UPI003918F184
MSSRLALYHPSGQLGLGNNVFGKDVANLDLFRALARHGGFEQVDLLVPDPLPPSQLAQGLLGEASGGTRLASHGLLDMGAAAAAGALLRGLPDISDLAWMRRRVAGDRAYSLLGLIHTIAPPITRQTIAATALAPTQPWDALICTSPSVREALARMFEEQADYLAERAGGGRLPTPNLPLVPLGVDGAHFAAQADRPQARRALREELGLAETDVLVIWVGRLSFFEKAFPQAMFRAVEEAARESGARVHFALAGWFPNPEVHRPLYEAAAQAYAPSVPVHFIDGNDRSRLADLWAAADVFLSLVDNIQETFGITPLEAMASGLPVVVSDWDGYRFTVRDGREGFLIPTLGGPLNGAGRAIAAAHVLQVQSYQTYVGAVAQHTAVHVGRAAQALGALAADPDLRRRMGAAGRERIRTTFDWPVVARQVRELVDELAAIRKAAAEPSRRHMFNPVKGDPFRDFAGFASQVLRAETVVSVRDGAGVADLERAAGLALDRFGDGWRLADAETRTMVDRLAAEGPLAVRALCEALPAERRRAAELTLAWLAKLGVLDWAESA